MFCLAHSSRVIGNSWLNFSKHTHTPNKGDTLQRAHRFDFSTFCSDIADVLFLTLSCEPSWQGTHAIFEEGLHGSIQVAGWVGQRMVLTRIDLRLGVAINFQSSLDQSFILLSPVKCVVCIVMQLWIHGSLKDRVS